MNRTAARCPTHTAHSQGSVKENPPSSTFTAETATLQHQQQRQPGRSSKRVDSGGQTGMQTDTRKNLLHSEADCFLNIAPAILLLFPHCPLRWLHATSSPASPPTPSPTSLLILSLLISPIHFSSLLTEGVYAESGTFCDDLGKVLQCSSGVGETQVPYPHAPFINRSILSVI